MSLNIQNAVTPVSLTTNALTDTPFPAQILAWTSYTHYIATFCGTLLLADTLAAKALSGSALKDVQAALQVVYTAAASVNQNFVDGITSMQAGKAPTYDFPPTSIPAWPTAGPNVFDSAWQIIEPALEIWQSKATGGGDSTFQAAIDGLIKAGNNCVAILKQAFGN